MMLSVLLVDPSLYTAPYDAALTEGLLAAGVQPTWATRPVRRGDRMELPPERTDAFFYRRIDEARAVPAALRPLFKGGAHLAGIVRLLRKVRREKPHVVHYQWVVVPLFDVAAMALMRRWCALVLTVHDTVAYNGQGMALPQRLGHHLAATLADQVIVHTRSGRQKLLQRGVPGERISVIPHGPLRLPLATESPGARDPRWTMVLFGEIKPYKGLDLLIEAVGLLAPALRRQMRVLVAGRPRMEMAPLTSRIAALGVAEQFELRLGRVPEDGMARLFAEADGFLFPYRQVDASGVYYLVKSLGKWMIASRVGVFEEEALAEPHGTLVPPGDVPALARALQHAIVARPRGCAPRGATAWSDIGRATRALYERALGELEARRSPRQGSACQR